MCFGYGTPREILILVDTSGSMVNSGETDFEAYDAALEENVFIEGTRSVRGLGEHCLKAFLDVITRAECRCPRWGLTAYWGGSFSETPDRFVQAHYAYRLARGIDSAKTGILNTPFRLGFSEDPLLAMETVAGMWGDWNTRVNDEGYWENNTSGLFSHVTTVPDLTTPRLDPETGEPIVAPNGEIQLDPHPYVHLGGKPLGERSRPPRRLILWIADEPSTVNNEDTAEAEVRDPASTIAKLQAAEISVIGFNVHPAGTPAPLNVGEQMEEIAAATGGVVMHDLKNRAGGIVREKVPDGAGGEVDAYRWSVTPPTEQTKKDWVDEVIEMLHRHKWKKSGYPYSGASS